MIAIKVILLILLVYFAKCDNLASLKSGSKLLADQKLSSLNGKYTLFLEKSGNLVFYKETISNTLWETNTALKWPVEYWLEFQEFGNELLLMRSAPDVEIDLKRRGEPHTGEEKSLVWSSFMLEGVRSSLIRNDSSSSFKLVVTDEGALEVQREVRERERWWH